MNIEDLAPEELEKLLKQQKSITTAKKEQQRAQEKAAKEQQRAQEKAAKEQQRAQEKAAKEQQRLADKAAREAKQQAAKEEREAIKAEKALDKEIKAAEKLLQTKNRIATKTDSIEEIIDTYNIWQSGTGKAVWWFQDVYENEFGEREWRSIFKDTLINRFPTQLVWEVASTDGCPKTSGFIEFITAMVEKGRVFTDITKSWDAAEIPGRLNLLHRNFCKPVESESYHWIFDALLESLTGGDDADTMLHMQQVLLAKWQHPENIFLPHLFFNDEGGTGKGLVSNTLLRRLYGGSVADNCNIDHITGKFNGYIAGKAIIVVNETTREKVDQEKLKAFLGSPTIIVEEKYAMPYSAENCGLVMCYSNSKTGGVNLSGTKTDRRFSIFCSKYALDEVVQKYFSVKENETITLTEASDWVESVGQDILFDEEEVGKWLHAMIIKYGDITNLRANKAAAYEELKLRQRGAWLDTVERVFTDPSFEYIRRSLLDDLISHFNRGEALPGKKTRKDMIDKLIADLGLPVEYIENASIGPTRLRRDVWATKHRVTNTMSGIEDCYGSVDDYNKWVWKWVE